MAIYHFRTQLIGRSQNRSAVAAAAYRSGSILYDNEMQRNHDYRQKKEVIYSEIFLPEHAPEEFQDRATLWNAVHEKETARDARLAREFCVALPHELPLPNSKLLISDFCKTLAGEGMCVDVSIHWKEGNHHAHIMCTTRGFKEDGSWDSKEQKIYAKDENGNRIPVIDKKTKKQKVDSRNRLQWQRVKVKCTNWDSRDKLLEWRERWADYCNGFLIKENQIDHRSLKEQGSDYIPTLHEGYIARQMQADGKISDVCEKNRKIKALNQELKSALELKEALEKIMLLQKLKDILQDLLEKKRTEQHTHSHTPAQAINWAHRDFGADIASARERAQQSHKSTTKDQINPNNIDR